MNKASEIFSEQSSNEKSLIIHIKGCFDASYTEIFNKEIKKIENNKNIENVTIDLLNTTYIDSMAIGDIIKFFMKYKDEPLNLTVTAPARGIVERALLSVKANEIIDIDFI